MFMPTANLAKAYFFLFKSSRHLFHSYFFIDLDNLNPYFRISLKHLNTFGDEVFGNEKVLQSYYYGINHFIVGGRCQCNGHSNVCIPNEEVLHFFEISCA